VVSEDTEEEEVVKRWEMNGEATVEQQGGWKKGGRWLLWR
jgi:hypothetical protein